MRKKNLANTLLRERLEMRVFCSFVCLLVDEWRRHSLMSKISWIIRREISSFPMHYPIEICSASMPDKSEVLLSK